MKPARQILDEAMNEADLQEQVEGLLLHLGWLVFHDRDSRTNREGFPDICAVHPRTGVTLFLELKVKDNKLSPHQERWCEAIERAEVQSDGWVRYYEVRPHAFERLRSVVTQLSTTGNMRTPS